MATTLIEAASFLVLFAAMAFGAPVDATVASPALELRQFTTMAIVGIICVICGVWLFFKTAH